MKNIAIACIIALGVVATPTIAAEAAPSTAAVHASVTKKKPPVVKKPTNRAGTTPICPAFRR